ncbi:MAG: hypothetical protein ACRETB_05560 [Steroidobacteraceae bacterium]
MPATKPARLPATSYRLSLHIRHPSIGPEDISRELQLEADECFAAGEPRRPRSGTAPESVYGETCWAAALDPEQWLARPVPVRRTEAQPGGSREPQEATQRWAGMAALVGAHDWTAIAALAGTRNLGVMLSLVCARLFARHGEFLKQMHAGGGSITLRATVSPRALQGFKIVPPVSQWLSELGMTLELEYLER